MAIKIKLRQKPISGKRQSLYLDFYPATKNPLTGKLTRREFLNFYVCSEIEYVEQKYLDSRGKEQKRFVPIMDKKGKPKLIKLNPMDKQHNKETLQLAEQIRQKRENQLNKPEIYTGYEKQQLEIKMKGEKNFVEYFKEISDKRKASNHDNWISAYYYIERYTNGYLKIADLNEKFCNDFKDYLLKSRKSNGKTLAQNSAVSYFNKLKAALKQAYKEGYLETNLNSKIDCIPTIEVLKDTLNIEELNLIAKTEFDNELCKKVVLFSALTGMPFMEMQNLTWGRIDVSQIAGYRIRMIRQKTDKAYFMNISEQAYNLLGSPKEPNELIFEGLDNKIRYFYFNQLLTKAGIKKKMTFHDLRHTYGVLQIDFGTDIYTLQGNMGHKNARQTMTYGKISDKRKREAADRIRLDF
jgi:integrase